MCTIAHMHVPHMEVLTSCACWFHPSTMQIPGINLKSSGLVANVYLLSLLAGYFKCAFFVLETVSWPTSDALLNSSNPPNHRNYNYFSARKPSLIKNNLPKEKFSFCHLKTVHNRPDRSSFLFERLLLVTSVKRCHAMSNGDHSWRWSTTESSQFLAKGILEEETVTFNWSTINTSPRFSSL